MSVRAAVQAELATLPATSGAPFDVHVHTGADIDGTRQGCEELLRVLEPLGGRAAIFPFCVQGGYALENRRVIEESRRYPGRLVPFARIDPGSDSAAEAADALAAGARGFKLHPRAEDFRLDHPGVDALAGVAAEARAPVLIHAGLGVGSYGETILALSEKHPRCPIVLAHAAISDLRWLWREVPAHPNLYFDTAWWNPSDLIALFALVPPGRILFGSDAPYMDLEAVLAIVLRCARFVGLSEETIGLVAGGQFEHLLAGDEAIDAGPPPGPPAIAPAPEAARLATALTGAGGALLGGGDPTQMLELARLTIGEAGAPDADPLLADLLEEAEARGEDSPWALALALALLATPGVETAMLAA